ncbi:unnamed protein product, partial [Mesorhabditis spiculigera]
MDATTSQDPQSRKENAPVCKQIGSGAYGAVWSVIDPRTNRKMALKTMPHVFLNLLTCKRAYREVRMLDSFCNDNVLALSDILHPRNPQMFQDIWVLTEMMETDLHKIISSRQALSLEHTKLFLYQTLRGLKYLHSANILHRDIKPSNLLVNGNCLLKICDFGLARVWNSATHQNMSHEVVTMYYRAPELLMGARSYTGAVDIWSVGCIFGELAFRKIFFQADTPYQQLHKIIEFLGSPGADALKYANEATRNYLTRQAPKPSQIEGFRVHAEPIITDVGLDLLLRLLMFNPDHRLSVEQALHHPFLIDGRTNFHTNLCSCCTTADGVRYFTAPNNLDPVHKEPFDPSWETEMDRYSMFDFRNQLYQFIITRPHIGSAALPDDFQWQNMAVHQPSQMHIQ